MGQAGDLCQGDERRIRPVAPRPPEDLEAGEAPPGHDVGRESYDVVEPGAGCAEGYVQVPEDSLGPGADVALQGVSCAARHSS